MTYLDQPISMHPDKGGSERGFEGRKREIDIEGSVGRVDESETVRGFEGPNVVELKEHQSPFFSGGHPALGPR